MPGGRQSLFVIQVRYEPRHMVMETGEVASGFFEEVHISCSYIYIIVPYAARIGRYACVRSRQTFGRKLDHGHAALGFALVCLA
jgi:hypothetical protein